MTLNDLRNVIGKQLGSKAKGQEIVDLTLQTLYRWLSDGEDVNLAGFGRFSVVERKAHKGRNPSTGEAIDVAATTVVKFKPHSKLKEGVAN